MIVIDVNLLVYAYDQSMPQHVAALSWFENVLSTAPIVYLPWQSICGFFRIMTHKRLPGVRCTEEEAARIIDSWLELPNVRAVGPGAGHWPHFRRMLVDGQAGGALGSDAALAALLAAELIYERAGGIRGDRPLKAIIPGGSSVPLLLPDQLDTRASFDDVQKAGSLLGSAACIVLDDSVCMVWLAMNLLHFYRHESCGKCTPCREGSGSDGAATAGSGGTAAGPIGWDAR